VSESAEVESSSAEAVEEAEQGREESLLEKIESATTDEEAAKEDGA